MFNKLFVKLQEGKISDSLLIQVNIKQKTQVFRNNFALLTSLCRMTVKLPFTIKK